MCREADSPMDFSRTRAPSFRSQPHSRQDPPGDEQKLDTRPTTTGELAADSETKPEEVAEVDRALGRGQITCLWSTKCQPKTSLIWGDLEAYR